VWGNTCVFYAVHAQGPEMLQIILQLESARVKLLCFGSLDALVNTDPHYEFPQVESQHAGRLFLRFLDGRQV
jgi:hypothetical protein